MEALLGDMERPHVPAVSGGFIQSVPEVQAETHEIHACIFPWDVQLLFNFLPSLFYYHVGLNGALARELACRVSGIRMYLNQPPNRQLLHCQNVFPNAFWSLKWKLHSPTHLFSNQTSTVQTG